MSRLTLYFLMGIVGLMAVAGVMAVTLQQSSPYSHARIGGPFAMTEMTGRPVSDKDLRGKPSALFFGYTSCPDVCPTTLLTLSNVLKRLGPAADRLNVVFVTVDPQRDTAEQIRLYLSSFDPRIRGFTGSERQVDAMADMFHVFHRRVPGDGGQYGVDHYAGILLFDRDGRLAGEIPYGEAEDKILAKLDTLGRPATCVPGAPPTVDLWSGATLKSQCGTGPA